MKKIHALSVMVALMTLAGCAQMQAAKETISEKIDSIRESVSFVEPADSATVKRRNSAADTASVTRASAQPVARATTSARLRRRSASPSGTRTTRPRPSTRTWWRKKKSTQP